jgi:hypothetical protein
LLTSKADTLVTIVHYFPRIASYCNHDTNSGPNLEAERGSMRTTIIRALAILALLFVFSSLVFGQAETGQITGTVTDPTGAIVSGAKVTITDVNTGASRTATTNGAGSYTITNLKPSTYDVVVEGPGFAKFSRRIDVTVGSKNEVSAQMSVTGGGTTVEVTAESGAAEVNTESQTLSSVVTGKEITELPSLYRTPYDFIATSGNVESDPSNRGAGYSINGQRSASTDILLDGGENVDLFTATVGQSVPLDSVQELRVVTSDFTAEYGRASGGVVNVATKSGTNNFHGSAYEFNRVSALAANTYNNDALRAAAFADGTCTTGAPCDIGKKSPFTRNQFGFSFGGPVIKNKLFFFNNTEWIRTRSTSINTQAVIDPAFLALTNANTQAFYSAYGATLRPGATIDSHTTCGAVAYCAASAFGTANPNAPFAETVSYGVPNDAGAGLPSNTYDTVSRVDYNITDKTTLYARYAQYNETDFAGSVSYSPYAGYDTPQTSKNNNAMLNLTHVFSPNFVSQSKIVYNRLANGTDPLGTNPVGPTLYFSASGVPSIGSAELVGPGYLSNSPGNAIPFGGPQNLYQAYQDLSWTKGKHQFRFGGDYIQTRDNRTFGAYETAVESLSQSGSYSEAVDNLVGGTLGLFEAAVNPQGKYPCVLYQTPTAGCEINTPVGAPSFTRNNRYNDGAWYAQDSWKIKPRLTLNLGVRWEYYGVQHNSDPNLDSNFYPGAGSDYARQLFAGTVQIADQSSYGGVWQQHKNNYAPRLGFAWDVFGDGKTSLRGGYGISFERNFGNVTYNIIQNPPNYAVISISPSDTGAPIPITTNNAGPLAGSGTTVPLPPVSLRLINPKIGQAYSEFYSLALDREVLKNSVLAFEYTGSKGVHLYDLGNVNKTGYGSAYDPADTSALPCAGAANAPETGLPYGDCRLLLQYGNANQRGSQGGSKYNALNTRFTSNNLFNKGLQMNFNWTWSHTMDNLSNTFSEGPDGGFQLGYVDYFHPNLDWGNSEFDARHRVAISGVWEIPWGKTSSNGFMRTAVGGWSFSPIFTYHTGQPFSVYDCTNAVYNCPRWQPGNAVQTTGSAGAATAVGPNSFDYIQLYPNGGPTAAPGLGQPGVGGTSELPLTACQGGVGCTMYVGPRNNFTGPGNHQFNAVLAKSFRLTERFNLQFRGEFYNVLNNHNFSVQTGNAEINSGQYVTAVKGGYLGTAGGPNDERRNIQFGLKLGF